MASYLKELERRRRAEKLHKRLPQKVTVRAAPTALESGSQGTAVYVPTGAPQGTRIEVSYPIAIFGVWKMALIYPGEPVLHNAAHVYCGADRRLKAEWERNVGGTAVMQAFVAAFDQVLRQLGPRKDICT